MSQKPNYYVEHAPQADLDMIGIFDYIHSKSRDLLTALGVTRRIEKKIEILEHNPHVSELFGKDTYRLIEYPYLIFYTINEETKTVSVVHIRHGAEQEFLPRS